MATTAARTPLPTDRLHFGLQSDEGAQLTWLKATNLPIKYRYQYLVDGVNTGGGNADPNCGANAGWQTWASPAGAFATNYINDTVPARIPVFTYYQIVPSNPAAGSDATADELTKIKTLCTMQAYWADYTVLLQKVGAYGGQVVIQVEPDFWGTMETSGSAVTSISADVANTGNADLTGLPNTLQGMAWAYLKLRDKYAPNALLAIHVNNWQGGTDLSTDQTTPVSGASGVADTVATWMKPAGFVGNPSGVSTWDLVFNDVADHDAASYNPLSDSHWWDKNNVQLPNFARWLAFMSRLHSDLGVPLVVWQVPVGNQYYDTMNNTAGHYQDNRVEYFLAHPADLTAAGIVAVLIGKANSGQTNYIDDVADGTTNPASVVSFECNLCNNHASTVSDDDGGYIRNFIAAYYNTAPPPPPGPSCPASSSVPCFDHVFTILMENTSYSSIIGSSSAPYINSLAAQGAVAGNYFATDHPSLPNYLELTSGGNAGITSDCTPPGTGCTANVSNIADSVESSGRTWKAYEESAPGTCPTSDSGQYVTKHDPFVYYNDIRTNSTRCNKIVPYTQLATDLGAASSTPNYAFITPNLCNDMHDCSIQTGDTWLSNNVPSILTSPAFTTQKSLLVIVWDEDDFSGSNQVAWIGIGYNVKTNYISSVQYDHYAFLKTVETAWGLPALTGNDGSASAMSDVFGAASLTATAGAAPTAGQAPLTVSFTGSASGGAAPFTYSWNFGDGTAASTSQNPSHTYSAAGTYTAHLTVTDSASHTVTVSAPAVTVTAAVPLSATAAAVPAAGDAPTTVAFTGAGAGGTAPYSFAWTFGDGTSGTGAKPSHTYSAAGTYTAVVTVTDATSQKATASAAVTVSPGLGAAAGATPQAADAGDSVSFSGSASGGLGPFSYSWNFGDGSAGGTTQNPSHVYAAAGFYTATLSVTDANGVKATATVAVAVHALPTVGAQASPSAGDAPLAVSLSATPAGGTSPYAYSWDFGDASPPSSSQNPSHTYSAAGSYTATVTMTDALGHTAKGTVVVAVSPALGAAAGVSPTSGQAPLTVNLTATPSGGKAPFTYSWNFGDGSAPGTVQNPSHVYASAGTFTATVTVTDAFGKTATASAPAVTVTLAPLTVTASATPTAGDAPVAVSFKATAVGGTAPLSYAWDFGDGTTGTGTTPSHTYGAAGTYAAMVTVTDATNQTATAEVTIVASPALTLSVAANPQTADAGDSVSFSSTPSGGRPPFTSSWSFGDGGSSSVANPSHAYTAAGLYSATLSLTDANGVKVTAGVTVSVHVLPTVAAAASPSGVDTPTAIAFSATPAGGTSPYSFSWNFGDASAVSTTQNPSHSYSAAGSYTATVTLTDAAGHHATASVTVTVSPILAAGAGATPTNGQAPLTVNLSATPSGGKAPYAYTWDFGDGSTPNTTQNPSHVYATAGGYAAKVVVTDANGSTVTASAPMITVTPAPLVAHASASPPTGDAPFTTTLNGYATGGTAPFTYAWDLGDGSTSSQQNVVAHAYGVGSFTATLTILDSAGVSSHATTQVIVYPALSITSQVSPSQGAAPLQVAFSAQASGGLAPFRYAWNFGDGTSGSGASGTHTYGAGSFGVTLTVTDAAGGSWTGGVASITSTAPPAPAGGSTGPGGSSGGANNPPAGAATPTPTATPSAEASPSTAPSPAGSGPPPAPRSQGLGNGTMLVLVIGGLLVPTAGGLLFVAWRRFRAR